MTLPPMLARRTSPVAQALTSAFALLAALNAEAAWLEWSTANDPEEPRREWGWVA